MATTDPEFVRWTQWMFLRIWNAWYDTEADGGRGRARPIAELEREFADGVRALPDGRDWADLGAGERRDVVDGYRLAYVSEAPVNWCPGLGTVLSNEEVTNEGRSERGNFPVFKRNLRQWMMRISAYSDRLTDDLDRLDWPEPVKLMQRNWIGRSHGAARAVRRGRRSRHRGLHHAAGHAVRRDVHGAGTRAPAGRPDRRPRPGRTGTKRRLDRRCERPRGRGGRLPARRRR